MCLSSGTFGHCDLSAESACNPTIMLVSTSLRRLLRRPRAISCFHTTVKLWASRKVVQKFKLADIGEGITECEVVKWCV